MSFTIQDPAHMEARSKNGTTHSMNEAPVSSPSRKVRDKRQAALKAKQSNRKFRGSSIPDPTLGISLEDFTSFTEVVKSSKRILALLGAGLSASSGLATFRGADRVWRGIEPQDLSDEEAFFNDPVKVWWFFSHRMMLAQKSRPNRAHVALTKFAREKPGFFAINQNIDGLCERAGFPQAQRGQVHGTLFSVKCSKYKSSKDRCDYMDDVIYPMNTALTLPTDVDISDPLVALPPVSLEELPHCPRCNNLLRPNVVLFGESTPSSTTEQISNFTLADRIDLMLVIGTSALVFPAALSIVVARNAGARVAFFNMEECNEGPGELQEDDWMFKGDAASTVPEMLKGVIGTTKDLTKK